MYFYRVIDRNDVGQFKECRLKYGVGSPRAQTDFFCDGNRVTGVELDVVSGDIFLYLCRQMFFQFFVAPNTVEQEEAARFTSSTISYLYRYAELWQATKSACFT